MFDKLKQIFIIKLALITPDLDKKLKIKVNTSDYTIEGVF